VSAAAAGRTSGRDASRFIVASFRLIAVRLSL
jgi:hypothetical protein